MRKVITIVSLLFLPIVSLAENLGETREILESGKSILEQILIPLVFTLALLLFFWGIAMYIFKEGQGKEEGKKIMIWGVVALFVASSVWGLVRFIRDNLNIKNNDSITIPGFQSGSGSGTGGNAYDPDLD